MAVLMAIRGRRTGPSDAMICFSRPRVSWTCTGGTRKTVDIQKALPKDLSNKPVRWAVIRVRSTRPLGAEAAEPVVVEPDAFVLLVLFPVKLSDNPDALTREQGEKCRKSVINSAARGRIVTGT